MQRREFDRSNRVTLQQQTGRSEPDIHWLIVLILRNLKTLSAYSRPSKF